VSEKMRHAAKRVGSFPARRRFQQTMRSRPLTSKCKAATVSIGIAAPTGMIAGAAGGLCGVGGGIVLIPVLHALTNMTSHKIVGTSLCAVSFAASLGAYSYIDQEIGNVSAAALLAGSALVTSGIGVAINKRISGRRLKQAMGIALVATSPFVAMKSRNIEDKHVRQPSAGAREKDENSRGGGVFSRIVYDIRRDFFVNPPIEFVKDNITFVIAGLVTGFASGLLGVGGGIISTTYMSAMTEMSQIDAVATSLIAMVPTGIYGTALHSLNGNVRVRTAGTISFFCAAGMYLVSSYVAPFVDDANMRKIFAGFLCASGLRMCM